MGPAGRARAGRARRALAGREPEQRRAGPRPPGARGLLHVRARRSASRRAGRACRSGCRPSGRGRGGAPSPSTRSRGRPPSRATPTSACSRSGGAPRAWCSRSRPPGPRRRTGCPIASSTRCFARASSGEIDGRRVGRRRRRRELLVDPSPLRRGFVRVLAGALKGQRLTTPRGRTTRPTADQVRIACLDTLMPFLDAGRSSISSRARAASASRRSPAGRRRRSSWSRTAPRCARCATTSSACGLADQARVVRGRRRARGRRAGGGGRALRHRLPRSAVRLAARGRRARRGGGRRRARRGRGGGDPARHQDAAGRRRRARSRSGRRVASGRRP